MAVLAKSAKFHGACVAGRTRGMANTYGPWIRPVVDREAGALPLLRTCCVDGRMAGVLDVVALPIGAAAPFLHQHENSLLADGIWRRVGRLTWDDLESLAEVDGVWPNGYSSTCGVNDRVPATLLNPALGSLKLIRVAGAILYRARDLYGRLKLRAAFEMDRVRYNLCVTDPAASSMLGEVKVLHLSEAYFCISLGLPFQGNAYKLVASVITPTQSKGLA